MAKEDKQKKKKFKKIDPKVKNMFGELDASMARGEHENKNFKQLKQESNTREKLYRQRLKDLGIKTK